MVTQDQDFGAGCAFAFYVAFALVCALIVWSKTGGDDSNGDCHPSYDPCVPNVSYDLDCDDLSGPYSVTGADEYGLDADGDGQGCES